jgi:hypothetical protein
MNPQPFYPVGLQNFAELRQRNAVYVDKTNLIYKLTHDYKFVFLSRPRRFGKTLLTSTLQHYFQGHRELFGGLAMEHLEKDWAAYPVLRFDLGTAKSKRPNEIEACLSGMIRRYEDIYGKSNESTSLSDRLIELILRAKAQTGKDVVVLIDEYDAPLLEVMHHADNEREEVRDLLRKFYAPLKACDDALRFVFLTGISRFSQLGMFSEVNNLEIITHTRDFASICGITKSELLTNFQPGIQSLANHLGCTTEETVTRLTEAYDGYHFCQDSEGVFNPFSLLNAFKQQELGNYWFATGTPRFLVEMLRKYQQQGKFNPQELDHTQPITARVLELPIEAQQSPIPLLYQAGYLTIKDYDREVSLYTLGIPNTEVRVGMLQNLLPLYADVNTDATESIVVRASAAFRKGDADEAMQLLKALLTSIPFMKGDKAILADAAKTEAHYHILFYFFFRMLHNEVYAEVRNAVGACDVVVQTPKFVYVIELKIDSSAEIALKQIDDKGYAAAYATDSRTLIKLGVNFSSQTRSISEWKRG